MLRVPKAVHEEVIAHCQSRYPKEACGLLAGAASRIVPDVPARLVLQVYPMTNIEDSPIGYSMDPKEQLQVEKQMRQRGQRLMGIYHSHTATDAYPSPVDVNLSISQDLSYVLVSLKDRQHPVMKSYRIDGSIVTPEELLMESAPSGMRRVGGP